MKVKNWISFTLVLLFLCLCVAITFVLCYYFLNDSNNFLVTTINDNKYDNQSDSSEKVELLPTLDVLTASESLIRDDFSGAKPEKLTKRPVLKFFPSLESNNHAHNATGGSGQGVIIFNPLNSTTYQSYVQQLDNRSPSVPFSKPNCPLNAPPYLLCVFRIDAFPPTPACSKADSYGYPLGKPCIRLELTDYQNWAPEDYNSSLEIPSEIARIYKRNHVTITCGPKSWWDKDEIGIVNILPSANVPFEAFNTSSQGQQEKEVINNSDNNGNKGNPFVFIRLETPTYNVPLRIACKAWAKNLDTQSFDNFFDVLLLE